MTTPATRVPAAEPAESLARFEARLRFETDCRDVLEALAEDKPDFILLDVRSPRALAEGHVDGAVNLPHAAITREELEAHEPSTTFVVYCAGPHCNGANKVAVRIARLGYRVKEMIGGIIGWLDEGHPLARET